MNEQSTKNKEAWEYRAYEFWNMREGSPAEKAKKIMKDPKACLKIHQKYFHDVRGLKIGNPCGSNGRKAVPLALMGADVTVFDISKENMRYAMELADSANTSIEYVVGDFYDLDLNKYNEYFDMLYLEGGILHYFNDISEFMKMLYAITKKGGKLILSDFHPFRKIISVGQLGKSASCTKGNYFNSKVYNGDLAYKSEFSEEEQGDFPDCSLRFYTLNEIINAVINVGFTLKEFNEHPNWEDEKIPGEFTILGIKQDEV
ncbi:class I SAM-dependent methyltransferase [Clostridium algidicarnis]|uniref:class I SAM-dependent methyltransferase n=1 Tax=Clostridium algidicarnis TaxID=37659 RepID=UPI00162A962F|nr:class I SAM-dependent methyltransferase [Clostridium algidicarnis]MBB6631918.1 class I SAM-dependent methyltransferase [Clostridium algidicarnis]